MLTWNIFPRHFNMMAIHFFIDAGPLNAKDAEIKGATNYVNLHPTGPDAEMRGEFYGEIRERRFPFPEHAPRQRASWKGVATSLYRAAIDWARARGLRFESDREVTFDAEKVYKKLQEQGYNIQRNPNLESKEGGFIAPKGEAAFTLVEQNVPAAEPPPAPAPAPVAVGPKSGDSNYAEQHAI
jgi:GNAT superfamily N-acetyltransferase